MLLGCSALGFRVGFGVWGFMLWGLLGLGLQFQGLGLWAAAFGALGKRAEGVGFRTYSPGRWAVSVNV